MGPGARRRGKSMKGFGCIGNGLCLTAVSHGRVSFDTHNEFRLAVTALSGG